MTHRKCLIKYMLEEKIVWGLWTRRWQGHPEAGFLWGLSPHLPCPWLELWSESGYRSHFPLWVYLLFFPFSLHPLPSGFHIYLFTLWVVGGYMVCGSRTYLYFLTSSIRVSQPQNYWHFISGNSVLWVHLMYCRLFSSTPAFSTIGVRVPLFQLQPSRMYQKCN